MREESWRRNYEGESSVFNINVGNLKINKSKSNINATIDIGSVSINNVQGTTTIFTGKGEINLNNIIGDVNCNTNFGNVNGINLFPNPAHKIIAVLIFIFFLFLGFFVENFLNHENLDYF